MSIRQSPKIKSLYFYKRVYPSVSLHRVESMINLPTCLWRHIWMFFFFSTLQLSKWLLTLISKKNLLKLVWLDNFCVFFKKRHPNQWYVLWYVTFSSAARRYSIFAFFAFVEISHDYSDFRVFSSVMVIYLSTVIKTSHNSIVTFSKRYVTFSSDTDTFDTLIYLCFCHYKLWFDVLIKLFCESSKICFYCK